MSVLDRKKVAPHKVRMVLPCTLVVLLGAFAARAQTASLLQIPTISVAAGIPAGQSQTVCTGALDAFGNGCAPTQAILNAPASHAIDSYGNIYIADTTNKELRVIYYGNSALATAIATSNSIAVTKVTPGNIYNLIGGGTATATAATGTAGAKVLLSSPVSVALDADGNVFMGDNASRVRVLYVAGTKVISLLKNAGQAVAATLTPGYEYALITPSTSGYSGDGAAAANATTDAQRGLIVDANENVYIADSSNNAVRKITASTGIISTYIGSTGCVSGTKASCTAGDTGDGGPVGSAETNAPWALALDPNGNLYVGEEGSGHVRAVYLGTGNLPGISSPVAGNIYLIAGGGTATTSGSPALSMTFDSKKGSIGIGFDPQGDLYIADGLGDHVWRVDAATQLTILLAGGGTATTSGGPCSAANPTGSVATDAVGDGCLATQATFNNAEGNIQFDAQGNLYVIDSADNLLRKLSRTVLYPTTPIGSSSAVQTLGFASLVSQTLGAVSLGVQGAASADFADAGASTCTSSAALATGATCLLNVKFAPALPGLRRGFAQLTNSTGNIIDTVYLGGTATGAALAVDTGTQTSVGSNLSARGVAVDPAGNIYVADATTSSLQVYAGNTATTPTATLLTGLSSPGQVAVDGEGNVYVADTGNNRIAVYNKALQTTTYLTNGLKAPQGIAIDTLGDVYVADTGNQRIVEFLLSGNTQVLTTTVVEPTRLTFDASGNLYILDSSDQTVVELPGASGTQATVTTASYVPLDIAVDAAGNLYVLDATTLSVGVVTPSGTTYSLLKGLAKPAALALDATGDVYVADPSITHVLALNRQIASLNFNYVQLGTTAAGQSFTLTNIGSTATQFTLPGIASASGNTTVFTTSPGTSNGCASTLAVAAQCSLTSTFSPVIAGTYNATLTFPSNAGPANTTSVLLTGVGKNLAAAPLTLTLSSPSSPSNISYGTPLTLGITLTAASGTPTGTIQILNNGVALTTINVVSGTTSYSYTFTPNAGNLALTGVYSGDTNFASSSSSLNLTVSQAPTTTTLTVASNLSATTPSIQLTAQVSAAVAGLQGSVTFYNGSTVLATVSLSGSGSASYTPTGVTFASLAFSATYNGSANFAPSTSATQTLGGDFGITPALTVSTPQGGIALTSFTVTPYFGLSGTVKFSCAGLPANSVCRPFPQTLTFTGANDPAAAVQLQIFTNQNVSALSTNLHQSPWSSPAAPIEATTLLSFLLLLAPRRARKKLLFAVVFLSVLPMAFLSGCSGTSTPAANPVTPVGQYNVTLTALAQNGASHAINITFSVVAQ